MKKNSPFRIFFTHLVHELTETGELKFLKRRAEKNLVSCEMQIDEETTLGFSKLTSPFLILSFGAIIGIFIVIYECVKKPQRKKKKFHDRDFSKAETLLTELIFLLNGNLRTDAMRILQNIRKKHCDKIEK